MDRGQKLRNPVQAERHMADGEQHILGQHMIIARLEREDRDATFQPLKLTRIPAMT